MPSIADNADLFKQYVDALGEAVRLCQHVDRYDVHVQSGIVIAAAMMACETSRQIAIRESYVMDPKFGPEDEVTEH